MGLRETIKRILREETKIPTELRRRIFLVHRVIDKLLPNMYVCDYNSADHFVTGVLDEITLFKMEVEELKSIERIDIENYIFDYKYDELVEYFNERCKNKNLQESIRRILREELVSREVEVRPEVFYSFANLPNKYWISDKKDMMYPEEFFNDKNLRV